MQTTYKKNFNVQLEGRVSLDILSVKNLAKLSAREVSGVEVGNGDLRWSSYLTVCHGHFGLSETEETKLEKYCFLEVRISLWYWLRRDLKEDLSKAQWVHFQRFWAWWTVDLKARRLLVNQGLDLDLYLDSLVITGTCLSSRDKKWYLKQPRDPT